MRPQPGVGEELAKLVRGERWQPFQDTFEVCEWINLVTLATRHQDTMRGL
jgi:hypothetical protein